MNSKKKGYFAENIASNFLKKNGYNIIAKNWSCKYGEIDIIAKKLDLLIFFEVKYRTNHAFGEINYSIDKIKLSKIKKTIYFYLNKNPYNGPLRVDAILIKDNTNPILIENILET